MTQLTLHSLTDCNRTSALQRRVFDIWPEHAEIDFWSRNSVAKGLTPTLQTEHYMMLRMSRKGPFKRCNDSWADNLISRGEHGSTGFWWPEGSVVTQLDMP